MGLSAEARERIGAILEEATALPEADRRAFVETACGDSQDLRREVLSLLRALERAGGLLEPAAASPREATPASGASLTGFRFGTYVVAERLGAGGMGVVYRATDERLGRSVAVKALPPAVASDPARRSRLEQEARALAVLNHPNIAAIYGAEDTERGALLLLEHVPGETLAERIARGGMAVDEVIAIARQVALGLEAAHAMGIVHRDLKPANVRVTAEGIVKVLDFGIAQVQSDIAGGAAGDGPGQDSGGGAAQPGSGQGSGSGSGRMARISGTASYMSPEQAKGRRTDRRTDVWAFGCLLFELLVGERLFTGESASDTLGAVLRAEPEWSRLPASTPAALRRLMERCLRKDPERRLRDLADARLELDDALAEWERPTSASSSAGGRRRFVAAAIIALAALGAGYLLGRGAAPERSATTRVGLSNDVTLPLEWDRGRSFAITTADGGELLAFTGHRVGEDQGLFLQRSDELEPRRVDAVGGRPRQPEFSPDGEWVAFTDADRGRLMLLGVRSGAVEEFAPVLPDASGLAWIDAGTIVYTRDGTLEEVTRGGTPRRLTTLAADRHEVLHGHVCVVPGGDLLLFTCEHQGGDEAHRCSIEAVRRATGERWTVRDDAWAPLMLGDDTLLWCEAAGLLAARFDSTTARMEGSPAKVLDGIGGADEFFPVARVAVAGGTLAYLPGIGGVEPTTLAWFHRDGRIDPVFSGERLLHAPRLSPDGRSVAFAMHGTMSEVWVRDLETGTMSRVGPADGWDRDYPFWFPDGGAIAVAASRGDVQRVERIDLTRADAPVVLVERSRATAPTPNGFSPDGRSVLITMASPGGERDLYLLPVIGGEPTALFPTHAPRTGGRFSPDGKAILYLLESASEDPTVVVETWPGLDRRLQVSERVGARAEWRPDGRAVFYRHRAEMWEVEVSTQPGLTVGPRRLLNEAFPEVRYAPAGDGSRFLVPIGLAGRRSGSRLVLLRQFDTTVHAAAAAAR